MTEEKLPFCECGECGLRVTKSGNRFIWGHNGRGVPQSPKHSKAISEGLKNSDTAKEYHDSMRYIPNSPEHNAAIKKGCEESDDVKAVHEAMRGGNDLVTHHYIYDESDLSLNTVQMARKGHTSLHRLLQKLGYIVPHINVTEENKNVFGEDKDE